MLKLSCPNCAASLKMRHKQSLYIVCEYCQAMIIRHDMDVTQIGTMAELQDEWSPIKIGTMGIWNKKQFRVLGRVINTYDQGRWSEWFIQLPKGQYGWLVDAQGEFAICLPASHEAPEKEKIALEVQVKIGKDFYVVSDIKDIECVGSEGELPFPAPIGRKATSIDLEDYSGNFAALDYSKEGIAGYLGNYIDFSDMRMKNLNEIEDW